VRGRFEESIPPSLPPQFLHVRHGGMNLPTNTRWPALRMRRLGIQQYHETTGESGRYLDDWKSSFSFPFALDVLNGGHELSYLLEVRNCRCSLEFPVRNVVSPQDGRLKVGRIHRPFADEFDGQDMNDFVAYFCSYLAGYWQVVRDRPHEPFLHTLACNCFLFGYCGGNCFEEQYASVEDFEAACSKYEKRLRRDAIARNNGTSARSGTETPEAALD
jgi:hypothetical protein